MSFNLRNTLEKLDDIDKDYRYMACNDLLSEMAKEGFQLDADSTRQVTRKMLEKVSDTSNEVQGLVVRCLGGLVKFANDNLVDEVIESLCGILEGKESKQRDIATLGLKAVITELPASSGLAKQIGKKLTPRVTKTASDDSVPEVQLDALDILQEMLKKFGQHMVGDHGQIQKVLLTLLSSPRSIVRKRSIICIGFLTLTENDSLLGELIKAIVAGIKAKGKASTLRAYMQAVSQVGRSSGSRIAKFVKELAPLVLAYVKDDEGVESEEDEELRENCFGALESFILRTPSEVGPFVPAMVDAALVYIKHDPNYAYDDDEAGAADDADDDDDDGGYGDDDDVSWKVRRASAKVLSALISSRGDMLPVAYDKVVPVLVARFREREEKVQEDIFNTLAELLRQTSHGAKHDASIRDRLAKAIGPLIQGAARQLKKKSPKTRAGVFNLLKELVNTSNGALNSLFAQLVPGVTNALKDSKAPSDMKVAALEFLLVAAQTHPATVFQPHIGELAKPVFSLIGDSHPKVASDALRFTAQIAQILRPEPGQPGAGFDFKPFVKDAFDSTLKRLKVLDVDQDVKESAIMATGVVLARFGDQVSGELGSVLPVLMERLRNEITRSAVVQAFNRIATSEVAVDLRPVLDESYKELASLLRKIQRPIKQSSLQALDALTARYGKDVKSDLHSQVLLESAAHVSDADLFLAHLALKLVVTTLRTVGALPVIGDKILPRTFELLASPVLQGPALQSVLDFFGELVSNKASGFTFEKLNSSIDKIIASKKPDEVTQQSFSALAKVLAELSARSSTGERDASVRRFIDAIKAPGTVLPVRLISLLALGELGSKTDLSGAAVQQVIMSAFESDSEEVKGSASYALGGVSTGNLQTMLPFVLKEIQSQPKRQYLLLQSLLTIVSSPQASGDALGPHLSTILDLLFPLCGSQEESVRNVVAECLGRLAVVSAQSVIPALVSRTTDKSAAVRGTVVTAVRFTIREQPQPFDAMLTEVAPKFMALLSDKDDDVRGSLDVRRATLHTINAIAYRKPGILRPTLKQFLPALLDESRIKPELIEEIIVGPYKHKVDKGLENRKAAFEVMFTLLDTSLDLIDFPSFLSHLASGLDDNIDIKTLCHLMLEKLAKTEPAAVVAALDSLVEPLQKTVTTAPKADAVAQDVERNEELIKSALRAIAAMSRMSNADTSVKFGDFVSNTIVKGEKGLPQKYEAVLKETAQTD